MLSLTSRLAAAAGAAAVALACSSQPAANNSVPEAGSVSCDQVDYASFDGQNPAVSFRNDVLPIQRRACAFSSCHGKLVGSKASLYLGPNIADTAPDDAAIADIITNMKDPAKTAPWLARVAPGDPEHSFLMMKLDACQDGAPAGDAGASDASPSDGGTTCEVQSGALSNNPCGDTMPRSGEQLSRTERDVFRRWIAQGAQDN